MVKSKFYSKQQINVNLTTKPMIYRDFQWFSPKHSLKTLLPWQQERICTYHSDFKISPIHVGKVPKLQEKTNHTVLKIFIKTRPGR